MNAARIIGLALLAIVLAGMVLGAACTGKQGERGEDAVGIESIVDNGNGTFTITLTDGATFTSSNLTGPRGEKGDKGDTGAQGIQGPPGEIPVLQWHRVATFTGVEGTTTASFDIPADDFRLIYTASTESEYPFFGVNILGTTTPLAGVIMEGDFTTSTTDLEYIRDGRQQFHLSVYAANLTGWTILVDAMY